MAKKKTGKCCECGSAIHAASLRCRSCSAKANKRKICEWSSIAYRDLTVTTAGIFVDAKARQAFFKSDDKAILVASKHLFDFPCVSCGKNFETHLGREQKKLHPWHCQSCAITCEWKRNEYHAKHVAAIKQKSNTPEALKNYSRAQIKKYQDPAFRARTTSSLRLVWASPAYKAKLSASLKRRWLENPPKCFARRYEHVSGGKQVTLKSSFERDFAVYLDKFGFSWSYEEQRFSLVTLEDRIYIPDFYVKDIDLIVEVKGRFWKDAEDKWDAFSREHPGIRKTILFKQDLARLAKGEVTLADYVKA
jgi:hypothetical protein